MKYTATQPELTKAIHPALYLRVSTTEQALDGYGLAAQRAKCAAMVTVKGWPEPVEFADEGISGTKDELERPGLAALLAAIAAGEVNAVIVAALDRVGRSTSLVLRMVERMEAGGADLVSCKESLDTSTPSGRFVLTLFAGLAQLDRDNIVERTTGGRNERGKKDGDKGGRLPLGYVRSEGIVIDPAAAAIVKQIFELRAGGATLTAIAGELNQSATGTRHGAAWYASSVREVLLNEDNYRGGLRGESPERWPAILGKD
jgi:site-specific DNA recombinase